jgi:hypothetical protein
VVNKLERTVIAVVATVRENVAFFSPAYLTMDSRDPSSLERKALKVPCRPARLA